MDRCWNCGQFGTHWPNSAGIRRLCVLCDVMWMAFPQVPGEVPTEVLWAPGQVISAVDFTRPGALSCPA